MIWLGKKQQFELGRVRVRIRSLRASIAWKCRSTVKHVLEKKFAVFLLQCVHHIVTVFISNIFRLR